MAPTYDPEKDPRNAHLPKAFWQMRYPVVQERFVWIAKGDIMVWEFKEDQVERYKQTDNGWRLVEVWKLGA